MYQELMLTERKNTVAYERFSQNSSTASKELN